MRHSILAAVLMVLMIACCGCGKTLPDRTGFLSSYEGLTKRNNLSLGMATGAEGLGRYERFMVDEVELRLENTRGLPEGEGERLAAYLRDQVVKELGEDYTIVTGAGQGVARVRMALTQITRSTMIMNLHPGMKITGAGLGGAAIEAEIVDSLTGVRVWALVESRKGNQMELDAFDPYDDAEDAAEMWAALMRLAVDKARNEARATLEAQAGYQTP
ncbi:MAG: DUF3313 domain-containing protein [Phycisphaeraceae bacterium]|nr:DUF3313 domain-containing protein [Phycisphaeraceae bacterium]MCW5762115.1 DUF3313 domain-containing protein [Phycisphaeraceae bacterium]